MEKPYELSNVSDFIDTSPKQRKQSNPTIRKDDINYVNYQEEDQMEVSGYQLSNFLRAITWFMIFLTLGLLRLLFHWKPHWMLICTHRRCRLKDASKVMLIDTYNQIYVETIKKMHSAVLPYFQLNCQSKESIESIKNYPNQSNSPTNHWSSSFDKPKKRSDGAFRDADCFSYFDNKRLRYIWDEESQSFVKLSGLDRNVDCSFFYHQHGLSPADQSKRLKLFGPNAIVVEVQSILQVFFNEVLEPFYVFQIYSIVLWCFDNYYYYASCILMMSALSLGSSLIQIRRNQRQLRDTVQGVDAVTVCRGNDETEEIESSDLVPGDVIILPPYGCIMQCDAVLISGNAIVNESVLTGESVPVTKIPLLYHEDDFYNSKEHGKHTLFCGTKVIQTRYYDSSKVKAVVIRTGFLTSKGELVRSIMFPKPVDFHFNRQIYKFILCLVVLAGLGFIYSVILNVKRGVSAKEIFLKACDLITVVIPPTLPAAMTIGVVYAQSRLRRSNIFCISPRSINISGCLDCVCFDKTGTLTEDDLSFSEIIPVDPITSRLTFPVRNPSQLPTGPILSCLSTCHSLTIIGDNLVGDPLDLKMFHATGWILEEPSVDDENKYDLLAPTIVKPGNSGIDADEVINNDIEIGILRQFPFSSSLQRMSVITRLLGDDHFVLYAKGAPEMISKLCLKETIPSNFSDILMGYTEKGYRVLGIASRDLHLSYSKMQRAPREEIEQDMKFLGLLVMSNVLKPETTYIIQTLSTANIRSVMITGDNMLTALSVGRECLMIKPNDKVVLLDAIEHDSSALSPPSLTWRFANADHQSATKPFENNGNNNNHHNDHQLKSTSLDFVKVVIDSDEKLHIAITGKTFRVLREYYPDLLNKVAIRGTIFARMGPDQKQQLIELLQDLGYYVGMCGDGANDCGALKAAHAGISLSDTEASVASPFTSKTPNISCIPVLISEGRASLVTAFGILKYMACYSLAQFISVIILYAYHSNLSDMEYLYIDLFLISLFFVLFGRTESFTELSKNPPPSSLVGIVPLASLFLQIVIIIIFQMTAVVVLWAQPWYIVHTPIDEEDVACHDNYAIFSVSVFQYISLALVFAKGAPYRKPVYSNKWFISAIVVMTILTSYIILIPPPWLSSLLELEVTGVAMEFRFFCLLLALLNFIFSYLAESFIVDYLIHVKLRSLQWVKSFSGQKPYEIIERETENNTTWLPPRLSLPSSLSDLQEAATIMCENGDDDIDSGKRKHSTDANGISSKESNSESGISLSSPASMASDKV
ncbi:polyamine-transporting ATPase 13A3-like isoform X2 [Panonychus citri]|uniref:polyamine-transporting ATPase 13A3-like n=1 Tax=Panonychus citri TaxID=50023 RepID=UPI0023082209|nr:polyamine-transporting ATPase 13A3-like [Panonychus citri]XP_053212424.1 polyamine-transporting ATPase 13A3-like isoform X2 [Panonychus citri]